MLTEILWKITQWFHRKKLKFDYSVDQRDENTYFTINDGKYKNVTVVYHGVQFFENETQPVLKFNYRIINSANYDDLYLQNQQDFVIILGDILQHYILEEAKNFETDRIRNTQEYDIQ